MSINKLAKNIINYREARNWSQSELARRVNLDNTVVNKIEKGSRKVSSDELQTFAKVFNVSLDQLVGNSTDSAKSSNELDWQDLGMAYGGRIPDDLKDMYRVIAEEYVRKHPEALDKNN
ncbi:MAG: helix-turn-helix transcriptional regulator [Lactobacillus sp.]|nr:helix-turn-helix transcriptional regulator [Lactobacillus sp.]